LRLNEFTNPGFCYGYAEKVREFLYFLPKIFRWVILHHYFRFSIAFLVNDVRLFRVGRRIINYTFLVKIKKPFSATDPHRQPQTIFSHRERRTATGPKPQHGNSFCRKGSGLAWRKIKTMKIILRNMNRF